MLYYYCMLVLIKQILIKDEDTIPYVAFLLNCFCQLTHCKNVVYNCVVMKSNEIRRKKTIKCKFDTFTVKCKLLDEILRTSVKKQTVLIIGVGGKGA